MIPTKIVQPYNPNLHFRSSLTTKILHSLKTGAIKRGITDRPVQDTIKSIVLFGEPMLLIIL